MDKSKQFWCLFCIKGNHDQCDSEEMPFCGCRRNNHDNRLVLKARQRG